MKAALRAGDVQIERRSADVRFCGEECVLADRKRWLSKRPRPMILTEVVQAAQSD